MAKFINTQLESELESDTESESKLECDSDSKQFLTHIAAFWMIVY